MKIEKEGHVYKNMQAWLDSAGFLLVNAGEGHTTGNLLELAEELGSGLCEGRDEMLTQQEEMRGTGDFGKSRRQIGIHTQLSAQCIRWKNSSMPGD